MDDLGVLPILANLHIVYIYRYPLIEMARKLSFRYHVDRSLYLYLNAWILCYRNAEICKLGIVRSGYIYIFGYFWTMGESESPLEWFGKHLNMEVVGFLGRQDRRPEDTHGLRQMVNYVNIKNAIETHGSGGIKYTHMNGSCFFHIIIQQKWILIQYLIHSCGAMGDMGDMGTEMGVQATSSPKWLANLSMVLLAMPRIRIKYIAI